MKKIIILTIALLVFTGCQANNGVENTPTLVSTDIPTMEPTSTVAPIITEMLEGEMVPMFYRVDYNLAEFAVCISSPFEFTTKVVSAGESKTETNEALCVYYLDKDYLGTEHIKLISENIYGGRSFGGGISLDRYIDGHHIFISENEICLYFSRCMTKDSTYALYRVKDIEDEIEGSRYVISDIKKFIKAIDNKIYYQDVNDDIYSFDMATMETDLIPDYEVIDYNSVPTDAIDYTNEYVLFYDDVNGNISIYSSEIIDGKFIVDSEIEMEIDISETGNLLDVKAANNYIFMIMNENDKTALYRYSMESQDILKLYETEKEFDAVYATENDYFAAFYDGNYNVEAIKFNYKYQDTRIIYDDKTCVDWNHVANGETDDIVEEHRYADINYMIYKGNILFGFNIDDEGITTLVFRTEVIDRELLPQIEEE